MSIKNIKERLEGSYRLIRIKRIKLGFFSLELALGLVLGMAMAMMLGAEFEPLYFPLDTFAFILLIMVLVISIEAIYFKGVEIKYTRNKSRRYLLARNAIRRSAAIIAVSGLCVLVLMLPYTHEYIADLHSPVDSFQVGAGESNQAYFMTQDRLGLARASSIVVDVSDEANILTLGGGIWIPQDQARYEYSGLSDFSSLQGSMTVEVENLAPLDISVSYAVTSEISPLLRIYLPALGLAFIVVQFAAISIMYPIRELYASTSIYSKKYVARTDAGEYSVSQIKQSEKEKEEEKILDEVLEVELPPAPAPRIAVAPAKPMPKAPEPEMARAKGKVDDGLIEEPDVKCSKCGEMNSAHAAMCFSCGNPMVAAEKVALDPMEYLRKGETFAKAGKYEDAIACYDEALKREASNETLLLRKGEALHRLGKWGSAVQYVNTALKVNPENLGALVLKAKILEERDRLDKSMEIYAQILALDPGNAFAKSKIEKVSRKFVEVVEEAEMESTEDVLEQFMCLPGIGLARATALYETGFTSMDMLKKATEAQIARVKGISKGIAKKIRKGLDSL